MRERRQARRRRETGRPGGRRARREEWVELRVTDEGPGIPDHERTVLRNGEETALVHGSGMGLWLVRTVVRRIGGRLRVRDAPDGSGSTVVVSVPVVEPDGADG
nr:ATP-binding protein [Halogeometricum sp. CBA1124]